MMRVQRLTPQRYCIEKGPSEYYHGPLNTEPGVYLFYNPIWPPGRRYASVETTLISHNYYSIIACSISYIIADDLACTRFYSKLC